jgi:hypothetical protein
MVETLLAAVLGWPASLPPQVTPDLAGHWRLVEQETSAPRGRSSVGAHEEDLVIRQSDDQLSIHYEPGDGTWDVRYALDQREGAPRNTGTWTMSRWDGSALVTRGRRRFKTHDGAEVFDFEERRTLSPDGSRLTLVTRIDMFPKDLVRTSAYARVPATARRPPPSLREHPRNVRSRS